MKFVFALLLQLGFVLVASAQDGAMNSSQGLNTAGGKFIGKIVDGKTNKGVEAASVQLFQKNSGKLAGGMLTKPNGDFSLGNLSPKDSFRLVITAIGFKEQELVIFFTLAPDKPAIKDLGNIKLEQESQFLGAVTVTAQKPALTMDIDRKVFNADRAITAAGGTAVDLMKNIPSVTVDVEGNVQLRNASPQIFVDGRPTILTLDQIPADNIDRVELITNPSAKFDAASSGGIINVVLKKNKRIGLNGSASAGVGSPGILNGNLTLNLREGKFNFFASGNYNQSGGKAKGETFRQNKSQGVIQDYFNQNSLNERERKFRSVRFGLDYFLDNRNTITVTQNFVRGNFSSHEDQQQEYLDVNQELIRYGDRTADGNAQFNRSNTQLLYKHNFAREGKELSADISYNTGKSNDNSSIINNYYKTDGSIYQDANVVRNFGNNNNDQLTMQLDFVNPISETQKWEVGLRSFFNNYNSVFNAYSVESSGVETKLPLSNNYDYRENVNAAYATFSGAVKKVKYQLGLRTELSRFDGELVDSAQKFGYQYPKTIKNIWDALFPSIFLTKELAEGHELQVNYSRRIRRPNFWQLNPFVDISDPVNLRQGNPALRPEFVNSFEINYNRTYNSGSFLAVLYYRNNPADITEYSDTISAEQFEKLNNAAVDPNAILNTFVNAQSNNRVGAEFTLQQRIGDNFDFTPSINMQYRKVNAVINNLDLSNDGFNWEAKLIANYRIATENSSLFNKLSFQLTGEYESPEVIPQGKRKEQYNVDMALRKEFLKNNKAALTFSVNDVFNTRRFGTIYDTEQFYQDSYRRWNVRSFRLTFTYKFGSSEFTLFPKKNNERRDDENNTAPDNG
ncbi:TonB-dependent receptor [Flavitalea sp.]|nr:outer membrane beta-barrel family protein [Flavitalea sp.]